MVTRIRLHAAAAAVALALGAAAPAHAGTIQLGFILDSSGSIGSGNWTTITGGLANAINVIPVGGPDTYEVSVVVFSTSATNSITGFLVNSGAARTTLAGQINALAFQGGNTNFAAAFSAMQTALSPTIANASASYVNFATDGVQNVGGTGVTERNNLITAGVDNISIEAIGSGIDASDLQTNFCYPQACDTTSPYSFPAQGFYIGVANATQYAAAIENKIRVVTGQVPEPGTMLLMGAGLLGFGFARRRKV
jgi:hypothetical protein